MTSIYAQAYVTLVLDSGLMSIRGKSAVWGDPLIAQILTCRWATRSWCHQEGCLSERCAFRLAEKILLVDRQIFQEKRSDAWRVAGISKNINISWILPRVPQQSDNSHDPRRFWRVIAEAKAFPEHDELFVVFAGSGGLLSRYSNTSDNEQAESHIQAEFANVWNALAGRYTTMIEDVDLIFATVLDFDIQPLSYLGSQCQDATNLPVASYIAPFHIVQKRQSELHVSIIARLVAPHRRRSRIIRSRKPSS